MKVLCLGGAGKISRESVHDLVQFSDLETITLGDFNEEAGHEVVAWLNDPRVDFKKIDINDKAATVRIMRDYDIVMDGTTISLNDRSTACIAEAGVHGINLNGFGDEYKYDSVFRSFGKVHVPGFGMTPGITDMMTRYAIDCLDTVDTIRISHGAFRPIAFSASITETTTTEYDPNLPNRLVYENGEFVQVPPFARPLDVALPEPYGTLTQYIIPHSETKTVVAYLDAVGKPAKLVEVRGTWPLQNMQLVRALYDWGILRNKSGYGADRMCDAPPVGEYFVREKCSKIHQQSGSGLGCGQQGQMERDLENEIQGGSKIVFIDWMSETSSNSSGRGHLKPRKRGLRKWNRQPEQPRFTYRIVPVENRD